MKTIYEVNATHGVQIIDVVAESKANIIGKYREGFEWIIAKNEISKKADDGKRYFTNVTHAKEVLRRTIVAEEKKISRFKEQLNELQ